MRSSLVSHEQNVVSGNMFRSDQQQVLRTRLSKCDIQSNQDEEGIFLIDTLEPFDE